MKKDLKSVKSILLNNDFITRLSKRGQHITTEHQDYGIRLAYRLNDKNHKSLYVKLAKEIPRNILEICASFAIDYPIKNNDNNKGRIFMWKLKILCDEKNIKIPYTKRKLSKKKIVNKIQVKMFK